MTELEDLPLEERISHYREHATRMMRMASTCSSEPMRMAYLRLAAHWQSLVLDLEQGGTRREEAFSLVASLDESRF